MNEQIPPNPPLEKGGERLAEALAWLDYCLGETAAAMGAVQEAALEEMRSMRSAGETPAPLDACPTGDAGTAVEAYHAMCEAAAGIITFRGRVSRGFRASCPVPAASRGADET